MRRVFPLVLNIISLLLLLSGFVARYYFGTKGVERHAAQAIASRRQSPVARPDQLIGSGRIYLVQMGAHRAPYSLDGFAQWLRSKYGLEVEVLPPVDLDSAAWNRERRQYVAELLTEQLKRYPVLAEDPQAYLIGFTDADMYAVHNDWRFTFTWRDGQRTAVVSTHRMQDSLWERIGEEKSVSEARFQARLRRILLKDVAVVYWHLPLNYDPASVLRDPLDPDLPLEDIYESDLKPERTRWGRSEGEPCIYFAYSAKGGTRPVAGKLIRTCDEVEEEVTQDESTELFQVDLRLGLLIDKHTDFYLPDSIPIQFRRATRDGWPQPMGFGLSGSHNYDNFLGSDDGMRKVTIYGADHNLKLKRVPSWLGMLSLVKFVDSEHSGRMAEMRWRTKGFEHFELKRYNGEVETYLPCSGGAFCYQVGFRNAQGEELLFERDAHRKLTRLESPNRNELRFSYDDAGRISEIADSRGRKVDYSYDDRGRLVRVSYPSGEVLQYQYDDSQHLLTFSAALSANDKPEILLRNEYEQGRIAKQTFSDGKIYRYNYKLEDDNDTICGATVHTPEGATFELAIGEWDSAVRERQAQTRP